MALTPIESVRCAADWPIPSCGRSAVAIGMWPVNWASRPACRADRRELTEPDPAVDGGRSGRGVLVVGVGPLEDPDVAPGDAHVEGAHADGPGTSGGAAAWRTISGAVTSRSIVPAAHRRPSWCTSTARAVKVRPTLSSESSKRSGRPASAPRRNTWWPRPRGAPAPGVRQRRSPGRASGCPRRLAVGRRCGRRRRRRAAPSGCTSSNSTRCVASPQVGKRLAAICVVVARGRRRAPRPAPGPCRSGRDPATTRDRGQRS